MLHMQLIPFIFLAITILNQWFTKKLWAYGIGLSILSALFTDIITYESLPFLALLSGLWVLYLRTQNAILFVLIVSYSIAFKWHLIPGFNAPLGDRLFLRFDSPLVGLAPLFFLTPLAQQWHEWKDVFTKGLLITAVGLLAMTLLAVTSGVVSLHIKIPSHPLIRYSFNLIFVSIIEEAFYRAFIQDKLIKWLQPYNKSIALILTSLLFTFAHLYWAPNIGTFVFIFLAGLLYGYVYIATKRIESAILCHFLLNVLHMTFFTYHAM